MFFYKLAAYFQKSFLEEYFGSLADSGTVLRCFSKNLFFKSYSKFIIMQKSYFRKSCMEKKNQKVFLNYCMWKIEKAIMDNNKLFNEAVSFMLNIQLLAVRTLFSLKKGFIHKLLIITCHQFSKLCFSTPKMSYFQCLN